MDLAVLDWAARRLEFDLAATASPTSASGLKGPSEKTAVAMHSVLNRPMVGGDNDACRRDACGQVSCRS